MPFTAHQFFEIFAKYNAGVWPAQVVLTALALSIIVLVIRSRPTHGRWIAAVLAVLWGWMAVAYHFKYFASINPAAWLFGALSLVGALWFAWVGVGKGQLHFALSHGVRSWVGAAFVVFALGVYPVARLPAGSQIPGRADIELPLSRRPSLRLAFCCSPRRPCRARRSSSPCFGRWLVPPRRLRSACSGSGAPGGWRRRCHCNDSPAYPLEEPAPLPSSWQRCRILLRVRPNGRRRLSSAVQGRQHRPRTPYWPG